MGSNPTLAEVPKIKERINMLKEVLADIEDHYVTSKDEDARIGHKSEEDAFFGYKTHIAMSDERIITAATVTSGEKGDGPQLEELVEQSRQNGMVVETVVGDTAYSGKNNITLSNDENNGFELVARLHPTISNGVRKDEDRFDFNKDAGMFVCPAGHMAIRKARQGKKGQGTNQRSYSSLMLTDAGLAPKEKDVIRMGPRAKRILFRSSQRNINNMQTSKRQRSSGQKLRSDTKSKIKTQN